MHNIAIDIPEKEALKWLDLYIIPTCSSIMLTAESFLNSNVERALHEALFMRLVKFSYPAILKLCVEQESKYTDVAKVSIDLVPNDIRKKSAEEVYAKLMSGGIYFFDKEYPLLRKQMELICKNFELAITEMILRIDKNRGEISKTFFNQDDFGKITDIDIGGADSHNNGRATAKIETDTGSFMYKPHDVRQDHFVGELIDTFFKDKIRTPKSISFHDTNNDKYYGYCEFIDNYPSHDEKSTAIYYKNLGGFVALTHMLGSIDMHCENVLSDGYHPMPVDMETCFAPTLKKENKLQNENKLQAELMQNTFDFRNSVIGNGIFPNRLAEIREISPMISMDSSNVSMPVIDGKRISIYDYLQDYYDGFRDVYLTCLRNKKEIIEMLKNAPDFEVRVVFRPTNYYGKIQKTISDCEYYKDSDAALRVVNDRLRFNPQSINEENWNSVIGKEKEAILNFDIPYFYTKAHSKDIFVFDGIEIKDVIETTAIDRAIGRLENFNECEMEFEIDLQKEFIERAIVPIKNDFVKKSNENSGIICDSNDAAKYLIQNSLQLPTGRISWFSSLNKKMRSGTGLGYYNGWLGIVTVLNLYKKYYPDTEHAELIKDNTELCTNLISNQINYCKSLSHLTYPEFNINLENGVAGWIESLMQLYSINKDERYISLAREEIKLIDKYIIPDTKDISRRNGIAGLLEICCKYKDALDVSDDVIRRLADYIIKSKTADINGKMLWHSIGKKRAVSGLDCGIGGIGKALFMAGNLLKNEIYLSAAYDAFDFEKNIYNEEKGGWQDMFRSTVSPEKYGGYSSGNAGLGFLWLYLDDKEMLEKAVLSVMKSETVFSDKLKDGNLGTCDFLLETGLRMNRPELIEKARAMLRGIANRQRHFSDEQFHQVFEPSLFSGEAGVLYIMLRLEKMGEMYSLLL